MSHRQPVVPAPSLLETFSTFFDPLFSRVSQRNAFRQYLTNVLLPSERNKTLTGLANAEPVLGAQLPRVQQLQWFLSESTWNAHTLNQQRIAVLQAQPSLAPSASGVLVIDETGDRKSGSKTAHSGRQYLANLGKIDTGVVSVTSLWADADVYHPLDVEPYTPAHWFERGVEKMTPTSAPNHSLLWKWSNKHSLLTSAFAQWSPTACMANTPSSASVWNNSAWAMCWRSNHHTLGGTPATSLVRLWMSREQVSGRVHSRQVRGLRWNERFEIHIQKRGGHSK